MSVKLNLGIIGIGSWGKNLVRDFSKYAYIQKCTSNGDLRNIKWMKKNFPSIEYVSNQKEIFNDDKINAVVISTPIETHYSIIKNALLAKKHVFVEKPLSTTLSNANELIKIAKKNNLLLFVGHIFLYNEVLKKIIKIQKNEKINFINFEWNKFGTFNEDIFFDLLSHDLSIVLTLFGNPTKFRLENFYGQITTCDFLRLSLEFKKKKCLIQVNRCSNTKHKSVTVFTKNNIYIWDDTKLFKKSSTDNFKLIYKSKKTPLENECSEFIKRLNEPIKITSSSKLGKDVIQLIQKLR
tara:strand:+ start:60 stop:944 length:885 start_codon:yes stop_codon:yes gene_type:complete